MERQEPPDLRFYSCITFIYIIPDLHLLDGGERLAPFLFWAHYENSPKKPQDAHGRSYLGPWTRCFRGTLFRRTTQASGRGPWRRVPVGRFCIQPYNLSDPGMLVRRRTVRRLRLSELPDETHDSAAFRLLAEINAASSGPPLRFFVENAYVDATTSPTSTKNRSGQRDPEMRQVKKGNQYY